MYDRIAIAALALIAVIAALTFRDYGLGWDDFTHSQYGDLLVAFYASGFKDKRALEFVNLYLYGGGFDMAAALLATILPFDLFETRRLAGAIVGIVGLAVTWRIARRVGDPLAGLLALVLLATCPLYYGHMFINPKDVPFAVAMAIFLLGLARTLAEYPKPRPATLLILGVGFGLSIGSRIMAGFGAIAAISAFALIGALEIRVHGFRDALPQLGKALLRLWPAALLAYAVMAVVWPWGVIDPLNPIRAIGVFAHFFEKPWQELFEGTLLTPPDMPRRYVPVLVMLQLPELLLALGLAGAFIAALGVARSSATPQRRAIDLCILLSALLPIAVTVLSRPAMYNGIRHFVFVLPPLAVLGGIAASALLERARRSGTPLRALAIAGLMAGIAAPGVAMVRTHPYQYAAFNFLAGGAAGARSQFMIDYWGLSLKQAAQALRAHLAERGEARPAGRKWKVAVCGPHPGARVTLGGAFEPAWDTDGADFALSLDEFYCAALDAPVVASIDRAGVTFARAYDLRGRNPGPLFSVPPVVPDPPSLPTR